MRTSWTTAAALLLAGCGGGEQAPANGSTESAAANGSADEAQANGQAEAAKEDSKAKPPTGSAPAPGAPAASAAPGACNMQDEEALKLSPLRAVGTEPFWGARIEGRCVTYNHPDDQKGTRIWTRYTPGPDGGTWSGALGGKRFELRTRSSPGCSDGMSDKKYPFAAELLVGGEKRTGCAEPL